MARCRHPVAVRCLVLDHQAERLVLGARVLKPLDSKVCHHVGAVSHDLLLPLGSDHVRVVVESLAG